MKRITENSVQEEQFRKFLFSLFKTYKECRKNMNVPLDEDSFQETLENIDITFWECDDEKTTGTFNVTPTTFNVIRENFEKNGKERNLFLLQHEFTHLSSPLNKEIFGSRESMRAMLAEYKQMLEGKNNDVISEYDVLRGAIAVDEVLAQWCCEESNDFLKHKTRERKTITQNIMGEYITVQTDFSDNDIYSPLQQYVENLANNLGYEDLRSFASSILTEKKRLNDLISPETVEQLGYIGILCEGIYQDNGFQDFGLPASDIPIAITRLDRIRKQSTFSDGPDVGSM